MDVAGAHYGGVGAAPYLVFRHPLTGIHREGVPHRGARGRVGLGEQTDDLDAPHVAVGRAKLDHAVQCHLVAGAVEVPAQLTARRRARVHVGRCQDLLPEARVGGRRAPLQTQCQPRALAPQREPQVVAVVVVARDQPPGRGRAGARAGKAGADGGVHGGVDEQMGAASRHRSVEPGRGIRTGRRDDSRICSRVPPPGAVAVPGDVARHPVRLLTPKARLDAQPGRDLERAARGGRWPGRSRHTRTARRCRNGDRVGARRQHTPAAAGPHEAAVAHVHAHRVATRRQGVAAPHLPAGGVGYHHRLGRGRGLLQPHGRIAVPGHRLPAADLAVALPPGMT